MKLVVPANTVTTYVRGDRPVVAEGDLLLVRHHGIVPTLIRWACRLRRPRDVSREEWRAFCRVNHACVAVTDGDRAFVAQAVARGIVLTPLDQLDYFSLGVVHFTTTPAQLDAAVAFADESVGCGYGFLQIPADLANAATGVELSLGIGDRMVCSTASTRTLERLGLIPDRSPDCVTPAHLASYTGTVVAAT